MLLPFPDLIEPATAFPLYVQQGIDPARVLRIENVYLQAWNRIKCSITEAPPKCEALPWAGGHVDGAARFMPIPLLAFTHANSAMSKLPELSADLANR